MVNITYESGFGADVESSTWACGDLDFEGFGSIWGFLFATATAGMRCFVENESVRPIPRGSNSYSHRSLMPQPDHRARLQGGSCSFSSVSNRPAPCGQAANVLARRGGTSILTNVALHRRTIAYDLQQLLVSVHCHRRRPNAKQQRVSDRNSRVRLTSYTPTSRTPRTCEYMANFGSHFFTSKA